MRLDETDDFDRQLLIDAEACAPEFSKALHDRVMREVSVARRLSPAPSSTRWRWIESIAVAAAACVAVAALQWSLRVPSSQHAVVPVATVGDPLKPLDAVAATSREWDDELHDARYAYLDQDVQRFAAFVREAVPLPIN